MTDVPNRPAPTSRLALLATAGTDDADLPRTSAMTRVACGDPRVAVAQTAAAMGHRGAWAAIAAPAPTKGRLAFATVAGWLADAAPAGDGFRIRMFDETGSLVSVIRTLPACAVTHSVRSVLAVEDLKRQWDRDPEWDLGDTDGFDAHQTELRLYAAERSDAWEAERTARREARIDAAAVAMREDGGRPFATLHVDLEDRVAVLSSRLSLIEESLRR